jgi:hypothetical protein
MTAGNLKVPNVDVFIMGGEDGSLALLVGGYSTPITGQDVGLILSGKALANGPRKVAKTNGRRSKHAPVQGRPMCRFGDGPARPGKRLCMKHLRIAQRSAETARKAKKTAHRREAA